MIVALALVTIAAVALVVLGWLGLIGKLPPNGVAGIRTPFTRASDANWYATHRAAAPLLIFGGVASLMAGLAFLPFTIAGNVSNEVAGTVSLILAVVLAASAIAGWLFGTRSARMGSS